jgi:hypothetical protein
MTDKELRKLNRLELLEILLAQQEEIERLQTQLAETQEKLDSKDLKIREMGSIADASLALTGVLSDAQKAADLYIQNVYRVCHLYMKKMTGKDSMQDIIAEIEGARDESEAPEYPAEAGSPGKEQQ